MTSLTGRVERPGARCGRRRSLHSRDRGEQGGVGSLTYGAEVTATPALRAPSTPPDHQRARVYRAEDDWAARLDAARQGARLATVAGSAVLLPAERRLGSLQTAAQYAARLLRAPAVTAAVGACAPPALRLRRGSQRAHWEPPGTIALPIPRHGEPWALRETVLLHELAHHVGALSAVRVHQHRAPFPAVMLLLCATALGAEAALALAVSYGEHRVEVGGLDPAGGRS